MDAIINTKTHSTMKGGFWGSMGAVYGTRTLATSIEGIAVSFEDTPSVTTVEPKAVIEPEASTTKSKRKSKKAK